MSRSRKKNMGYSAYGMYKRYGKIYANRIVRRYTGKIPNGGWYKKLFPSWDLHEQEYQIFTREKFFRWFDPFHEREDDYPWHKNNWWHVVYK